jgi:hypothetical protein
MEMSGGFHILPAPRVVDFTYYLLHSQYILGRRVSGPQGQSGHTEKEKNSFPVRN